MANERYFIVRLLVVIELLTVALSGACKPTLSDLCVNKFAHFSQNLDEIIVSVKAKNSRLPASMVGSVDQISYFFHKKNENISETEAVKEFSAHFLADLQYAIDQLDVNSAQETKLRAELNSLANELVFLYGFADKKDFRNMISELERVKQLSNQVIHRLCVKGQQ